MRHGASSAVTATIERAPVTPPPASVLVLLALGVRVLVAAFSYDVPGDGPSRALAAWEWLQHPHLITWGFWPPGLTYLGGLVGLLQSDPRWSLRIVNLVAGTMTVPVFYAVVRRIAAAPIAWAAAAVLATLPLHVETSASSLTESTFILEMLLGLWVVLRARTATASEWVVAAFAIFWATMTRYEAWWFAPIFVVAVAAARRWQAAMALGIGMGSFPVLWTLGNYRAIGDPFYGFNMARLGADIAGTPPVGMGHALGILAGVIRIELGPVLAIGLLGGAFLVARAARRQFGFARAVYAAVVATFWTAMTWFTMRRGLSVLDRYLLLGLVLLLPVAVLPWVRPCRTPRGLVGVAVVLALSSTLPRFDRWPPATTWVTWSAPTDVATMTAWLRASPYRDATIVFTEMGWASSYFALFWPEAAARRMIVSPWTTDYELRMFLRRTPSLLITMPADEELQRRIERIGGRPMVGAPPIATFGAFEVRPLAPAAR